MCSFLPGFDGSKKISRSEYLFFKYLKIVNKDESFNYFTFPWLKFIVCSSHYSLDRATWNLSVQPDYTAVDIVLREFN